MNYLSLGLYIHIPFCYSKCPYCGFFSLVDKSKSDKEKYLAAIKREIQIYGEKYPEIIVQSIYIGGFTKFLKHAISVLELIRVLKLQLKAILLHLMLQRQIKY